MQTPSSSEADKVNKVYRALSGSYPESIKIAFTSNPTLQLVATRIAQADDSIKQNLASNNWFELANGKSTNFAEFVVLPISRIIKAPENFFYQQAAYQIYDEYRSGNPDWKITMAVLNDLYVASGNANVSDEVRVIFKDYSLNITPDQKTRRTVRALQNSDPAAPNWVAPSPYDMSLGQINFPYDAEPYRNILTRPPQSSQHQPSGPPSGGDFNDDPTQPNRRRRPVSSPKPRQETDP
jgi:hypothetical protein